MAIRLIPEKTGSRLFCSSKWWGNPDMPPKMEYPMLDGYPLTFLCQIDCEDIAPLDPEHRLPHEGMLYFFAAADEYLGYETPYHFGAGPWPKGSVVVKYAKAVNMETFESFILLDEDDNELAEPPFALRFETCPDDADGLRLLGTPCSETLRQEHPDSINLLQMNENDELGLHFSDSGMLHILLPASAPAAGEWWKAQGYLHLF